MKVFCFVENRTPIVFGVDIVIILTCLLAGIQEARKSVGVEAFLHFRNEAVKFPLPRVEAFDS